MSVGHDITITLTDESFDFLNRASKVYKRSYSDVIERWLTELNKSLSGTLFTKSILCSQGWIETDIQITNNGNRSPLTDKYWDELDAIKIQRFYDRLKEKRENEAAATRTGRT